MTLETIAIRRETPADLATILYHRHAMFRDMGMPIKDDFRQQHDALFDQWLREEVAAGRYLAWFAAVTDPGGAERIVAGAGLLYYDWIPNFIDGGQRRGYILNVYTEPDYRGRGLARTLVERCVDHCRAQGLRFVALHASAQGRPIYEQIGFTQTNEMRLTLMSE
ncbi:MAG: GNAT family N-acetyltransferase [Anaerolinea sp.]|nr:GNAT family N-acetyltransferase [Anaerolinea sp.]